MPSEGNQSFQVLTPKSSRLAIEFNKFTATHQFGFILPQRVSVSHNNIAVLNY
jgi:hypothetical protein